MCRDADRVFTEATSHDESDRIIDRLSRELACLIDLGVLASDEEAAFSDVLRDLRMLAARARGLDGTAGTDRMPAKRCRNELSGMTGLLAADLDLAYQRLGFAA
ncbi:MAG: hypothetical protein ACYC7L_08345 [Nitrospirota bacterium]